MAFPLVLEERFYTFSMSIKMKNIMSHVYNMFASFHFAGDGDAFRTQLFRNHCVLGQVRRKEVKRTSGKIYSSDSD